MLLTVESLPLPFFFGVHRIPNSENKLMKTTIEQKNDICLSRANIKIERKVKLKIIVEI